MVAIKIVLWLLVWHGVQNYGMVVNKSIPLLVG